MKPLNPSQIAKFLERFDDFKGSEIRSLEIKSATEIELLLSAQDRARNFDWISVKLLFNGVSDAKILEDNKLAYLDMDDGLSILFEEKQFALGITSTKTLASIKDAPLYIICDIIKYDEDLF
jgi:hypothetical protein